MNTTIYNPANKRKDQLIEEFVVRTRLFESIMSDIKTTDNKYPGQHYLLIGQRGSGKTTLIHRVKYAIEDDKELSNLIPMALGEEQYGISELLNLWEKIGEILEDYYGFSHLSDEIENEINKSNSEENCFDILIDSLKNKKKILVLFIDNFGDLLKKFSDLEIKRLREILMTCSSIRLIAASPVLIEQILDYQKPLFEFFKTIPLKGLNNEEIKILLLKLSELDDSVDQINHIIEKNPERIEILRILTGGVTRTIVSLYKIFVDNVGGSSIKDLQLTLDAVTPLYKHRMDDLPKNQQKIVDIVAKSWDATSVKNIAKNSRIESKIVSAQLRYLEKSQIIEKIHTGKKNHLYQIKERFFNIWYLMRYGRKYDKKRVIWLVRFLESWCSKEELEKRVSSHIHSLNNGEYDDAAAILLGEAYLSCKTIDIKLKKELVLRSKEILPENLTEGMSISDSDLYFSAFNYYLNEDYEAAIKIALEISKKDRIYGFISNSFYQIDDLDNALKYSNLLMESETEIENVDYGLRGSIYHKLGESEKAIKEYKEAINKGSNEALGDLGFLYLQIDEFDLAEEYLLKGLKHDESKMKSSHFLGHLYSIKNSKKKAIKYYKVAIRLGDKRANLCLARLYDENNDFDNAKIYFKKALEYYPEESSIDLATILFEKDSKSKEAEKLLKSIKDIENSQIQFSIAKVYDVYAENYSKAKLHYNKSIKLGNKEAIHKLAHVYENMGDFKNAEKYFLKSYEINEDYDALVCLSELYLDANEFKEKALSHIKLANKNIKFNSLKKLLYAKVLLWNNEIETSLEVINPILSAFEDDENNEDFQYEFNDIIEYFIELISIGYYNIVYDLLNKHQIIDMFKPIYFTLMHYMKDEFPDEYLKMGEEIKEVVDEIINDIENKKK
ncbi:hypothetical protein QSE00_24935 [Arenibacter sp. M-2]|uniref:hypothetical protein n=1 Tax=Arenibacter sp. M-2 TaxID=3053612 RepID=UPI00257070D4|nr:hypothetical protein [Arenibacter sp. M-2]MDL5515079.1 hypothetical protein [Arenibacter sp. M-2]